MKNLLYRTADLIICVKNSLKAEGHNNITIFII